MRIGASAGLTLLYTGGAGRSLGNRWPCGVDRSPHLLLGNIQVASQSAGDRCATGTGGPHLFQPRHLAKLLSSGAVIDDAITSGLAPG